MSPYYVPDILFGTLHILTYLLDTANLRAARTWSVIDAISIYHGDTVTLNNGNDKEGYNTT